MTMLRVHSMSYLEQSNQSGPYWLVVGVPFTSSDSDAYGDPL
jgi:hypothetical protein